MVGCKAIEAVLVAFLRLKLCASMGVPTATTQRKVSCHTCCMCAQKAHIQAQDLQVLLESTATVSTVMHA